MRLRDGFCPIIPWYHRRKSIGQPAAVRLRKRHAKRQQKEKAEEDFAVERGVDTVVALWREPMIKERCCQDWLTCFYKGYHKKRKRPSHPDLFLFHFFEILLFLLQILLCLHVFPLEGGFLPALYPCIVFLPVSLERKSQRIGNDKSCSCERPFIFLFFEIFSKRYQKIHFDYFLFLKKAIGKKFAYLFDYLQMFFYVFLWFLCSCHGCCNARKKPGVPFLPEGPLFACRRLP